MNYKGVTLSFYLVGLCLLPLSTIAQAAGESDGAARQLLIGPGAQDSSGGQTLQADEFSGAATYSVILPVPPARGGVEPVISLNYNSQRKNPDSWVGYGWELDLGSIVRTPQNGAIDYKNGDAFDFHFSGQNISLILADRNVDLSGYGLDFGANVRADRYQAKNEGSFNIYLHLRDVADPDRPSDRGWIVIDKSGHRFEFGMSAGARSSKHARYFYGNNDETLLVAKWYLEKVSDTNGNEMTVSYDAVSGQPLQINYQDITVHLASSYKGVSIPLFPTFREPWFNSNEIGKRLDRINITGDNGRRIQSYKLEYSLAVTDTYSSSSNGHISYLMSIQQFGASDDTTLPATSFDYFRNGGDTPFEWSPTGYFRQASRNSDAGDNDGYLNYFTDLVDMNGDGLVDQVVSFQNSQDVYVYFNNGDDFVFIDDKSIWRDPFAMSCTSGSEGSGMITYCVGRLNSYYPGNGKQWAYLMDMNGDGLPDRVYNNHMLSPANLGGGGGVVSDSDADDGADRSRFFVYFNNGRGWDENPKVWLDPYRGDWPGTSDNAKGFLDMNGDGLVDRVVGNQGAGEFNVYFNTGAGFKSEAVVWKDPIDLVNPDSGAVGRFLGISTLDDDDENNDQIYAFIRDMNGDGLPDRIYRFHSEEYNGFTVFLNKQGQMWAKPVETPGGRWTTSGVDSWTIIDPISDAIDRGYVTRKADWIDFNGDGFLDRVEGDPGSGTFRVYLFDGCFEALSCVFRPSVELDDPVTHDVGRGYVKKGNNAWDEGSNWHTLIMDLNGDGYPDRVTVLGYDDGNKKYAVYPLHVNALQFSDSPDDLRDSNINQPFGAIKRIADGPGNETEIEYLPSSLPLRWPEPNNHFLPFNLYLVRKIYTRDYTLPLIPEEIPEAARHPGMRWTTYNYWGGNYFVRHAVKANPELPEDEALRVNYYSQFNGFQSVEHEVNRAPAEHWPKYKTTTRYVQALGDANTARSISDDPVFDGNGYKHFAISGRPYLQRVESEDGTVVVEESGWLINQADDSENFLCDGTCFPRLESRRKEVFEPGSALPRISQATYEYDDYGNITHERNFNSAETLLLEKETVYYPPDHFNSTLHIRNRPQLQRQKVGDEIYRKKEFDYDPKGNPTLEKFLADQDTGEYATITRTFYENGNLHQITDIDGIIKTINYDDNSLFPTIESVSLGDGATLTTTREFNRLTGEIAVETGPQGTGRRINYDDFGRPLDEHLRAANGNYQTVKRYAIEYQTHDISFAYSNSVTVLQTKIWMPQSGYPSTIADPFQITYTDPSGNILQECTRSPAGPYRQVVHKITVAGREDWQTEPVNDDDCDFVGTVEAGLRTYKTVKDFQGRTLLMDPPPGDAASPVGEINISYETDNLRRVVKKTRYPDGGEKQEKFNDTGRVEQLREVNGSLVNYEYNPVGDLRFVRNADTELVEIEYDLLGRKKKMTDANMGTWTYDYDDYGRLEWQTDNKGQKIHFIYTTLGRVERKVILKNDGSLERYEVYTYDSGDAVHSVLPGELFKIEEYDADDNLLRQTRYGYNDAYRRVRKITRGIPGVGNLTQTLIHDFRGNLVSTTYPGGETIYYKYGPKGGLTKVCNNQTCDATTGEIYYSVDTNTGVNVFGNLLREDFGNGVATEYDYHPNSHRLRWKKTYKGDEIYSERTYAYDEFSNITQISDPREAQGSGALSSIGYDSLNRLISYQPVGAGTPYTLTYSNSGKILTNTASYGANTYRYENASHPQAVTRIGTEVFTYDDNGNMISDPSRTMTYNALNQLIKVEMTNGVVVEYDYDYTGARVKKQVRREDPLHRIHEATTHYLGDAIEIKGDRLFLNIHAGNQKIATKSLGTMDEIIGPAAGSLRNVGINPEWRFSMAAPYLMIFFTLFIIASLRPFKFPHPYSPLPLWEREYAGGGRVRGRAPFVPRAPPRLSLRGVRLRRTTWQSPVWTREIASLSLAMTKRMIAGWSSYTQSLHEAFHLFHHRLVVKLVSLALIFLGLCEFPLMAMASHVDMPTEAISDPHFFYYTHGDHLGSSHILTEGKPESRHSGITYRRGQLLQRFEYSPFGQETFVLNPNLKFDPSYTGQTYDIDTGLYYYKSRYYNPKLARFIQPDTIVPDGKDLQSYNRYSYVNNNPLKYVDPTGHFLGFFGKLLGAFLGAFVGALVTVLTMGTFGPIAAAALGGLVGGIVGGGITGGIKGAVLGGLLGFAGGLIFGAASTGINALGINQWAGMAVMAGIGAGLSYKLGGWQGLATFGAGLAGGILGGLAGAAVNKPKAAEWQLPKKRIGFDRDLDEQGLLLADAGIKDPNVASDALSTSQVATGQATEGYLDINGTFPGITAGEILDSSGQVYGYLGFSIATPGLSITGSPNSISTGWNFGFQVGYGAGGQIGYGGGSLFWELGAMTPGISVSAYYIIRLPNATTNWR